MTRLIVLFIAVLFVIGLATVAHSEPRSSWLEDAWSSETVASTGGPAVTLGDSGVILVLPAVTMAEALAAGLTPRETVTRFLERWGQHCSDVLDLDQPQNGLKVQLWLSRPAVADDLSDPALGGIVRDMARAGALDRIAGLFVTGEEHLDLTVDYVPMRRAHCVTPGEKGPTS